MSSMTGLSEKAKSVATDWLIGSALVSQSPHGLLAFTQQLTPSKSPQTVCRVRKVRQLQVQANEGNVVLEVPNPPHFFPVAHFLFLFFEVYISAIRTRRGAHELCEGKSKLPRAECLEGIHKIARITPAAIVIAAILAIWLQRGT
ncbi:hypothetical protein B0H13DRAFT_2682639 [Mycena leptocephala]|nr:hypothetical protein B0H13DRAFT_2682639 [Mycena leptocephala]